MAKFVFQMQSLLNLKERIEEQKSGEYAKALQALEAEKRKLNRLMVEKDDTVAEFSRLARGAVDAEKFNRYNVYIEVVKGRIIDQRKAVVKAEEETEIRRLALVEAMKERKALETLREHRLEEFKEEEKRAEQRVVDEVVSFRFNDAKASEIREQLEREQMEREQLENDKEKA